MGYSHVYYTVFCVWWLPISHMAWNPVWWYRVSILCLRILISWYRNSGKKCRVRCPQRSWLEKSEQVSDCHLPFNYTPGKKLAFNLIAHTCHDFFSPGKRNTMLVTKGRKSHCTVSILVSRVFGILETVKSLESWKVSIFDIDFDADPACHFNPDPASQNDPHREYWMICREPGFLAVVWFGSSSRPSLVSKCSIYSSLPVCRRRSSLLKGEGGGGGEEDWSSVNHSIRSGSEALFPTMKITRKLFTWRCLCCRKSCESFFGPPVVPDWPAGFHRWHRPSL